MDKPDITMAEEGDTLINSGLSKKSTKFALKCLNLIENDEFYAFQQYINRGSVFCYRRRNIPTEILVVLENVLKKSSIRDDNRATYISLMWDKLKLWKNQQLNETIILHVTPSTNIRTLFSLLMFDWHNQDQCDEDVNYFLDSKFKQYEKATGRSLFSKLYETINASESNYRHVCLRIIYQLLDELNSSNGCKNAIFGNLNERMKIHEVLDISNKEFKKKILKVFVAYWHISDGDYRSVEKKMYPFFELAFMLDGDHGSVEKKMTPFFELAFMLKKKLISSFDMEFQLYIDKCKRNHGFYYEAKLKADNRLLLHIAEQNGLTNIRSFIFRKCPFNEVNATPLTNAKEISSLLNLNIYPWTDREVDLIKTLTEAYEAIARAIDKTNQMYNVADKRGEDQKEENRQEIDKQLKVLRQCIARTKSRGRRFFGNFTTTRNLLFERRFEELSLFEKILSTPGMKEVIELVFDMSDTLKNEYILQMIPLPKPSCTVQTLSAGCLLLVVRLYHISNMELAPSVSATKQSHTKTLIQGFVKFDFDDVYVPALGNFHVKSQYPRLKPKFERGKVDNGIVEATCDQLLVWVNQHFDTTGREKYFKELVLSNIVYTINVDPQLLFHSEQMELTLRIFFWLWYNDDVLEAAVSNGIDHKALKLGTDQIQSILTGKYDHDPVPKFNDVPDYPIFRNLFNSLLEWYNTCRNSLQEYENLIKPFANNLTTYFTTMRWLRVHQIDGRYSEETFKTYRKVTAFSDGIANAMALINGIKLTDEMANSVIMKRLLDIANVFGGYTNDLLGMKKEFTNGERDNLIVFLVLEKKVPLDEAVQQVCDLLADELTDYVLLREVILSEFDHDENLSRYLDNLDSLIDGHNKIYSLSLRHRAVGSVSLTR